MKKYSLSKIAEHLNGKLFGKDQLVSNFSIDSRTIKKDDVFICIKGKVYDGHDFIQDVIQNSSCIITSKNIENINLKTNSYIKVENTIEALHNLSKYIRSKSNAKFIAITGSNGKTTVKEMVAHILSDFKICYTKGNLNNNIGVPLTIFSINQDEDFIIIEIGSNNMGEIEPLAKIVKPDVAAVTNIGFAHIEGFKNLENTAKEKFSLFKQLNKDGVSVINSSDNYDNNFKKGNKLYFGKEYGFIKKFMNKIKNFPYKTSFLKVNRCEENFYKFSINNKDIDLKLAINGEHNYYNAGCAMSICLSLGIEIEHIVKKLENFQEVSSRLNLYKLEKNIKLIDDCYNANPNSFEAAITYLSSFDENKLVLMGDMVELGKDTKTFHAEIGMFAKKRGINKFLSIGVNSKFASDVFGLNGYHFENAESLKSYLNNNLESSSVILIKGSRSAKLEEYVEFLKTRGL